MTDITSKEYSVNSLLSHFSRVAFLDIDVGQGEYVTEGILTLSTIEEPQLRSSSVPCVKEPVFR